VLRSSADLPLPGIGADDLAPDAGRTSGGHAATTLVSFGAERLPFGEDRWGWVRKDVMGAPVAMVIGNRDDADLGVLGEWADGRGVDLRTVDREDDRLPSLDGCSLVVSL